jgi:hypothetical protein
MHKAQGVRRQKKGGEGGGSTIKTKDVLQMIKMTFANLKAQGWVLFLCTRFGFFAQPHIRRQTKKTADRILIPALLTMEYHQLLRDFTRTTINQTIKGQQNKRKEKKRKLELKAFN